MSRSRSFCFTWNNYDAAAETTIQGLPGLRYIVYGRELAPTTGTRHLQGFLSFTNARTIARVRNLLPGVHVDIARGTAQQNHDYCVKDGDFYEFGDMPSARADAGGREQERWELALVNAKASNLEAIPADILLRYYGSIKRIGTDFGPPPPEAPGTTGVWIHGLAGSGKTRAVHDAYPQAFSKDASKWWCGFKGQEVVLLDDIDPSHSSWIARFLKIWGDRYPFTAQQKGGSVLIRPLKFIVTSQYKIEDIFNDTPTREALNRRYVVIEKFINQNIII